MHVRLGGCLFLGNSHSGFMIRWRTISLISIKYKVIRTGELECLTILFRPCIVSFYFLNVLTYRLFVVGRF